MQNLKIIKYFEKKNFLYFFLFNFFFHLITINFYPTNFEGSFAEYGDFFNQENKINYLRNYYTGQFNTYIFSFLISILYLVCPLFDTLHYAHFLSAFSYFFWIYGIKNFSNYFKIDKILVFLIILNPLVFYYGFRIYSDFFAFGLAFYSISSILENHKKNYFYIFLYAISILLKPQNLIFIFIFYFLFFKKLTIKNLIIHNLILISPFLTLLYLNFSFLDFFLIPNFESNDVAIKEYTEIFSNFIFYIGYLGIACFPIGVSYLVINYKNNALFIIFLSLLLGFIISLFMSAFDSELSIGMFKQLIHPKVYDFIICSISVFTLLIIFEQQFKKRELSHLIIVFHIFCYIIILSFVKISPKYLLILIPFYYMLFQSLLTKTLYCNIFTSSVGAFLTLALLFNYYQVGYSTKHMFEYLKKKDIFYVTDVNPIVPHIYHLVNMDYFPEKFHIKGKPVLKNLGKKNLYKVVYADHFKDQKKVISYYQDNREIFGLKVNKFLIIEK